MVLQIWGNIVVTAVTADKTLIDSVLSFPSVFIALFAVTFRKAKHLLQCKAFITPQTSVVLRMKREVNGCVIRGNYLRSLKLCNLFTETVFA